MIRNAIKTSKSFCAFNVRHLWSPPKALLYLYIMPQVQAENWTFSPFPSYCGSNVQDYSVHCNDHEGRNSSPRLLTFLHQNSKLVLYPYTHFDCRCYNVLERTLANAHSINPKMRKTEWKRTNTWKLKVTPWFFSIRGRVVSSYPDLLLFEPFGATVAVGCGKWTRQKCSLGGNQAESQFYFSKDAKHAEYRTRS